MYKKSHVNVRLERGSTLTFTRDAPYIVSILFTRVKFTCVRTCKLRDSGNPPLLHSSHFRGLIHFTLCISSLLISSLRKT